MNLWDNLPAEMQEMISEKAFQMHKNDLIKWFHDVIMPICEESANKGLWSHLFSDQTEFGGKLNHDYYIFCSICQDEDLGLKKENNTIIIFWENDSIYEPGIIDL